MKITICTGPTYAVPPVRGGAVQRVWCGLAREFARRGHAVTVLARAHPGQPEAETIDGVAYSRWGGYEQSTSIRRDLVRCLLYALRAAPRVPAADVIVTNDFWMPAVLPWVRPRAGRVVACIQRFPKGQFALYRRCAAIVAVSRSVARGICGQTPAVASRVAVVPNCVDAAFLAPAPPPETRTAARLLYVGRLHPEKGLRLLMEALAGLKALRPHGWEAVLVGPSAESEGGGGAVCLAELRRAAEGIALRVEPPLYDPAALAAVYDGADVFVYPSVAETGEAFGVAPLEAMARGVVPVVSDLAVFRDFVEPGRNAVVFDHRGRDAARSLAEALDALIGDAGRRAELARAARAAAAGFSPEAVAGQYLELFERILSTGRP